MPFLSVIVPTSRHGGLDILLGSLAASEFTDFELVLVDAHFHARTARVGREARNHFLSVIHMAPLGDNPFPVCSYSHFLNSGLAAANGEVALLMVDYSKVPRDLLGKHAAFHKNDVTKRRGLMGPHRYGGIDVDAGWPAYGRHDIDSYVDDIKSGRLDRYHWSIGNPNGKDSELFEVDRGSWATPDADPKLNMSAGDITPGFMHCKNESVRLERLLEINGADTALDGTHGYQDTDLAERLTAKAGVRWTLDPSAVVEIVNPRHVFPFMKRTREFADNERIYLANKAAGFPLPNKYSLRERRMKIRNGVPPTVLEGPMTDTTAPRELSAATDSTAPRPRVTGADRKLAIAMVYGEFSTAIHGPFIPEDLYVKQGLTGSESSFFNTARSLAERGHNVAAFIVTEKTYEHPSGLTILPLQMLRGLHQLQLDAVIAWNEPDYLRFAPPGVPRIVDQQLNDFGYCRVPDWRALADHWVSPSRHHLDYLIASESLPANKCSVVANSVDLGLFAGTAPPRNSKRVVWCSSPDRGLHHLLGMWPAVRAVVPDAELKIFYRLQPWLDLVRDRDEETGRRARYIEEALRRLNNHGVTVVGPVSNVQMSRELQQAACIAYTCDPSNRYTEGFGCSVLDAAAGGCIPIISNADALPSVHSGSAMVLERPNGEVRETWIKAIATVLQFGAAGAPKEWQASMRAHAQKHDRRVIAEQWEKLVASLTTQRMPAAGPVPQVMGLGV